MAGLPGPARRPMGEGVVVAGNGAVAHLVSHAVVGLVEAHAALVVLQTVGVRDEPRDGGQLHGAPHAANLRGDEG